MNFVYEVNIVSNEMYHYRNYYKKFPFLYEIKSYLENLQRAFYLNNITFVRIKAFYNCSNKNITIKNPFGSTNVAVFDNNFNYLPTSSSNTTINFTVYREIHYTRDICIFEGYIGYSKNFTIDLKFNGKSAIEEYTSNTFNLKYEPFSYIYRRYGVFIKFDGICTKVKLKEPEIEIYLPSYSLNPIKIEFIQQNGNNLTVNITNNGECPIDLRNFMYLTNNLYKIEPDVNVYGKRFIIYPNETETFVFSNYNGTFCLVSLGLKKCI